MRPRPVIPAPDFSGLTTDGTKVRLQDFRGRKLVLYFYPMDDTPGCTAQACSLRDHERRDRREGRRDPRRVGAGRRLAPAVHGEAPAQLSPACGHRPRGRQVRTGRSAAVLGARARACSGSAERVTFIIDEHGTVRAVIDDPDTTNHAAQVLGYSDRSHLDFAHDVVGHAPGELQAEMPEPGEWHVLRPGKDARVLRRDEIVVAAVDRRDRHRETALLGRGESAQPLRRGPHVQRVGAVTHGCERAPVMRRAEGDDSRDPGAAEAPGVSAAHEPAHAVPDEDRPLARTDDVVHLPWQRRHVVLDRREHWLERDRVDGVPAGRSGSGRTTPSRRRCTCSRERGRPADARRARCPAPAGTREARKRLEEDVDRRVAEYLVQHAADRRQRADAKLRGRRRPMAPGDRERQQDHHGGHARKPARPRSPPPQPARGSTRSRATTPRRRLRARSPRAAAAAPAPAR